MNKQLTTKNSPAAIGPYSQAIIANGFIFCSGQIALQTNGEFLNGTTAEQTRQVLKNLQAILQAANTNFSKVVKTTIFLKSIKDFTVVNEVYSEFFDTTKPARSTVAVADLPKNALVEIEAIATL